MARLFDSGKETREAEAAREDREETRRRAQEADEALQELQETDEASNRLRQTLAEAQAVAPIRYEEYRRPGSRWLIEHSQVGEDYIFQLHPLRPPTVGAQDILALAITSMDVIFPRSLDIRYVPPSHQFKLKFYTIKVEKLAGLPGWRQAVDRALSSLSQMDAWPRVATG
jgi:hypothetical protein